MKNNLRNRKPGPLTASVFLALSLLVIIPSVGHAVLIEGDKAFPFSGIDLYGNPVDIRPLIGKQVIVLKFGSIYCSSCVKSIADLSSLQEKHPVNELKVVGINLDIYGVFRVKRFYRGYQGTIKFPIVIDEALNVSREYGITTLPSLVIIGKDGKIARTMVGYEEAELKPTLEMITKLVKARPGEEPDILGPKVERKFQVLFPTTFTKTFQETLYAIGKGTPGIKVALTLNGGSRQEVVVEKDFFYIRTPISLGSNFLEVSLVGSEKERVNQAVVIFRDPKIGQGFQVPFPEYKFHLKENEDICAKCHKMTPPESGDQNFMMITQVCLECHKELSKKSYVHGPITVGGCSPCHDFGSLPARYHLFTTGAELCYGCHEEKRNEFAKSYIHGPLAAGVCTICHSPHTANEKYQLRLPQGQLCMLCHQQIKSLTFEPFLHKPFEAGNCAGCHDPHSSENPQFFLKGVGDALCRLCHSEEAMQKHRHPVGTVPTFTFPGMKLEEESGTTFCSSCHLPHAGTNQYLLPKEGCPACHSY